MSEHAAFAIDDALLEGARRASGNEASSIAAPGREVAAVARRRQFPAGERQRILAVADQCKLPGEIGACGPDAEKARGQGRSNAGRNTAL